MPSRVFLDANAGVPARPEVLETFLRVERDAPANPASIHRGGRRAQAVLEEARAEVAQLLAASASEVMFTSGATEANHLGIVGTARALMRMTDRPIALWSSLAEHPSVLATLRRLQSEGCRLHLAPLNAHARVAVTSVSAAFVDQPAALAAVQWANNETGAVQPIAALADHVGPDHLLHVDAVQGVGKLAWDPVLARASTLALSGHKIGAPKGIGVLRLREEVALDPVTPGGGQQRGRRGGTESPALAAAFAHALRLSFAEQQSAAGRMSDCGDAFMATLAQSGTRFRVNHPDNSADRLPNTCNLSFLEIDGRALLPACDLAGLDLASGAACSAGAPLPSPVLRASGVSEELAQASCRVSFCADSTVEEAVEAGQRLAETISRLYEVAKR